jgi:hypothetical protein
LGAGRWGSVVWSLSQIGPNWGNRSLIILLLAIVGASSMVPLMHLASSRNEIRLQAGTEDREQQLRRISDRRGRTGCVCSSRQNEGSRCFVSEGLYRVGS